MKRINSNRAAVAYRRVRFEFGLVVCAASVLIELLLITF